MKGEVYSKERRILVTLICLIIIPAIYWLRVYLKFIAGNPEIINNLQFWAKKFFLLIPVMIVAMIIIMIIFAIIHKVVTNEDLPSIEDEMDKLIQLKALRISHWSTILSVILAIGSQAVGMDTWVMMVVLIAGGFVAGIIESIAQIIYYRRGV